MRVKTLCCLANTRTLILYLEKSKRPCLTKINVKPNDLHIILIVNLADPFLRGTGIYIGMLSVYLKKLSKLRMLYSVEWKGDHE